MGNVYVQFREEEQAANALRNLSGRFYAGQLKFLSSPAPLFFPSYLYFLSAAFDFRIG